MRRLAWLLVLGLAACGADDDTGPTPPQVIDEENDTGFLEPTFFEVEHPDGTTYRCLATIEETGWGGRMGLWCENRASLRGEENRDG